MAQKSSPIDPRSGFNSINKTFHSLRTPLDLPEEDTPLSAAEYAFSLRLKSPLLHDSVALINLITGHRIFYSEFTTRTKSLAAYLQKVTKLSKNDTAFILAPNSLQIPILYFSLLSLGVIISPANPDSPESEISNQVKLSKPVIAFATSSTVHKLPKLEHQPILTDSPEFESMMVSSEYEFERVKLSRQSHLAAILYSSGTTGRVKGVMLSHRNLISEVATICATRKKRESTAVMLQTTNMYFNISGFIRSLASVALCETFVVNGMERFDAKKMLKAVEEFSVTNMMGAPSVMVALCKGSLTDSFDLSSLESVVCGGAPFWKDAMKAFMARFPKVVLLQVYGMTETGAVFRTICKEESNRLGSAVRLSGGFEAKIVDTETGEALPPCKEGELWIKGPSTMKGYVGDEEATASTLLTDGWLRTGDLCYIDDDGFAFIADRIKELIKYQAFQVPPAELENLLISHTDIADAAVIPYPDEEAGEIPMAFVVRQPGSILSEVEIMHFVATQVAPHKKIRRVAFIDSIPKNASGKILRRELRKLVVPVPPPQRLL